MIDQRQLADELMRQIDSRIAAQFEQARIRVLFGTVDSVNLADRTAAVFLAGTSSASSPGFTYGEHQPDPGDAVAVLINPNGARMILRVTSRDVADPDTFAFFVS